jgi:hypothetical protein
MVPLEINSSLFLSAMAEAVEFLTSEVLYLYEKSVLGYDVIKHANDVVHAIQNLSRRRGSMFNNPDKAAIDLIMEKVLNDKVYFNAFSDFLKKFGGGGENLLMAYSELIEIEEKIINMPSFIDNEIKVSNILHYLNSYYDRYLALGAARRVPITEATHGDCLRKLANITGVEVD